MTSRISHTLRPLAFAALCAFAAQASAAPEPKIWVSMDEAAFSLLQKRARVVSDVERLPMRAAGVDGRVADSKVVLLRTTRSDLDAISHAMHEELNRCGGYFVHDSAAEARQSIARLRAVADAPHGLLSGAPEAVSYAIDNQAEVHALLPKIKEKAVLSHINKLAEYNNRFYTSDTGTKVSEDLATSWRNMAAKAKRSDVTVETVTHKGYPQKSVIMTITGTESPQELVVVGGHLDSVNWRSGNYTTARAPGADDNASGIATVTEIARALINSGFKPKRSLQFMGFAAEEVGLLGSKDVADRYKAAGKQVVGSMQLDMTAYKGSDTDITLITDYTNAAQNAFIENLAKTYLPELKMSRSACGYACSDHASWTRAGYPASFPFEADMNDDNKKIHTIDDTVKTFGGKADHAVKFARLGLTFMVELGLK